MKTHERGSGTLYTPKGSRFIWAQYYVNGKPVRVSTGSDKPKEAEKFLKLRVAQVRTNTHPDLSAPVTYEEMRGQYYLDYTAHHHRTLQHDADGQPYCSHVKRMDDFFGGMRAQDISTSTLREFIRAKQAEGFADGSINRALSALRRMFHLMQESERLTRVPKFPMLDEATPRQGFFEREQFAQLFGVLPDHAKLPVAIGFYSGMRKEEILGLTWAQVDFLRGVIHLTQTKNGLPRDVPVIGQLRPLLAERHAQRQSECPFVCYRITAGGKAVRVVSLRVAWETACVRCGLGKRVPVVGEDGQPVFNGPRPDRKQPRLVAKTKYEGLVFHDLRRTGVRNLRRAGVSETVAMRISGHETASIFRRYDITDAKDFADAGRKLEAFHAEENQHSAENQHRTAKISGSDTTTTKLTN